MTESSRYEDLVFFFFNIYNLLQLQDALVFVYRNPVYMLIFQTFVDLSWGYTFLVSFNNGTYLVGHINYYTYFDSLLYRFLRVTKALSFIS